MIVYFQQITSKLVLCVCHCFVTGLKNDIKATELYFKSVSITDFGRCEAWQKNRGMSKTEAMKKYVEHVR